VRSHLVPLSVRRALLREESRGGVGRAVGLSLACLCLWPLALGAQDPGPGSGVWSVDLGAGVGVPGDNIRQEVGVGPAGSAGLALALGRHVSLRADLDVTFEGGKELTNTFGPGGVLMTRGPDVTTFHYLLGLELFPVAPSSATWWFSAMVSLGATSLTGAGGPVDAGPWPTAGAGARIGRRVSSTVGAWAGVRAYYFVASGGESASINANFPIVAGVRIGL
jgi:hypothetical protein